MPAMADVSNLHVRRQISSLPMAIAACGAGRSGITAHIAAARMAVLAESIVGTGRMEDVGNGTEHATDRMDRHGPHGLSDGRAAAEGRLRRIDLEPHPRQGRAACQIGGKIVDKPSDLAGMDVVFSIVAEGKDVEQVYFGKDGVLSGNGRCRACSSTARPSRSRNWSKSASA